MKDLLVLGEAVSEDCICQEMICKNTVQGRSCREVAGPPISKSHNHRGLLSQIKCLFVYPTTVRLSKLCAVLAFQANSVAKTFLFSNWSLSLL